MSFPENLSDGYIFHLNRGCEGQSAGRQEGWLAVREMGIPTMAYEASTGDRRDYAESQVMRRIDAFMESLGLTRPEL